MNELQDIRDSFFDSLYQLACEDKNVIFITADMGAFSLNKFKQDLPDQYINIGIAEQNMISVAAGLSLSGKKVYVYSIASFVIQRCYEQIKIDLCSMNLPVTVIGVGAGIDYSSDGPTHHAIQDIGTMRLLPNMRVLSTSDPYSAMIAVKESYHNDGPTYIKLGKGKSVSRVNSDIEDGFRSIDLGDDVFIISTGSTVNECIEIADYLKTIDIGASVIDIYRISPFNYDKIRDIMYCRFNHKIIVTVEDHFEVGGIADIISKVVSHSKGISVKEILNFCISNDTIVGYGDIEWMRSQYGISKDNIISNIVKGLKDE